MRCLGLAVLIACGSPTKPPTPPAEPTGCTCEQLNAPIREPSTHEQVRWERTRIEIETVIRDVARVMTLPCAATVAADVDRIFAAHGAALADHRALVESTCEAFARWAVGRAEDAGESAIAITEAMRSGKCELSKPATDQLAALLIIRACTTVSGNGDLDRRGDFDGQHDERHHFGAQRDHRQQRFGNASH